MGVLVAVGCLVALLAVLGTRTQHGGTTSGSRGRAPAASHNLQDTGVPPGELHDVTPVQKEAPSAGEGRCASTEDALALLAQEGRESVAWQQAEGVERAACSLLVAYRDGTAPCVLAQSGYLDLLGNTWGCVIEGDGWVDVCVVREQEGTSTLRILRFDRSAVEDELG